MRPSTLAQTTFVIAALALASSAPLVAQPFTGADIDQTTARRDDSGQLIYNPVKTESAGNYHVLHNGVEPTLYAGLGVGAGVVPGVDGIGTWIPGEELKGNCHTSLGDFGYRQVGFRETVAVLAGPSPLKIKFPYIAWVEFDGGNGHAPIVFDNPTDNNCSVPSLGAITTGYGNVPAQPSFVSVTSPGTGDALMIPNEDILSGSGTATIIAEISNLEIPINDPGYFWEVQIEWITPLESANNIDGWYHWATSSPDNNQYFGVSDDELNLWHSYTIPTTFGLAGVQTLPAAMDYGLLMLSADPVTAAALAPVGVNGTGPYYRNTAGGSINGGFDLGRGSQMVSLSGISGVTNGGTGFGNQDPAGAAIGGKVPSLAFVTFDNTDYDGDGDLVTTPPGGSWRLTWVSIDYDVLLGISPDQAGSVSVGSAGLCRAPVSISSSVLAFPQPLTLSFMPLFVHQAAPVAWADPGGLGGTAGE
ncbi:MAG: hypothetical protein ACI9EF_003936, partial [Pseudohongiellaceae bacterium]